MYPLHFPLSRIFMFCLLASLPIIAKSQDTLFLNLSQAEEQFLKKNLLLLASKFNIEKQKALQLQAKAYPNPTFSANFNLYDPENDIFLHVDESGQKEFMFEQLILLGGKRKLNIEMAKLNREIAEAEFSDMLRELKLQLAKSYYGIFQNANNIEKLNRQISLLDTLITAYEKQAHKGNISQKDVIRLKSVYLRMNNERAASYQELNTHSKNMKILLNGNFVFKPKLTEEDFNFFLTEKPYQEIEANALNNRPDMISQNKLLNYAQTNLRYQKRSNIPDASFNIATDQRGGAFKNQVNAGVALQLPVWNQNRGNIRAAKAEEKIYQTALEQKKLEIISEVQEAYLNMQRSIDEFKKSKEIYNEDFSLVFKSVNENFQKKNISIIEFVDFFESYNEAQLELERIKNQIAISAAIINYVSASKIY